MGSVQEKEKKEKGEKVIHGTFSLLISSSQRGFWEEEREKKRSEKADFSLPSSAKRGPQKKRERSDSNSLYVNLHFGF